MLRLTIVLVTVTLSLTSLAQTVKHEQPAPVPVDFIDGAKTPNLIPDATARRLWLLAVTADDRSKPKLATDRRHAFLRSAGVGEDEMVIADEILGHFKMNYGALIANYNSRMEAGEEPSFTEFRAQRDALVQATQASLSGSLAPRSASQLKIFINAEKARMKVAKEVQ